MVMVIDVFKFVWLSEFHDHAGGTVGEMLHYVGFGTAT